MRVSSGTLAAAMVLSVCAAQRPDRDYPQWRGAARDGSASAFQEPKSWPDQLTRRWKIEVGDGYSTPIVVGDTVYTFTRRGDEEVLTALLSKSGKVRWRSGYAAPYEVSSPAKSHGGGPKSTPLLHNGKLFTLGISGIVSAFEATSGRIVWQTPAPAERPYYGAAVSALGYGDLVIVHPGNYGPLTAFDAKTGQVRWTAGGGGEYASPILFTVGGATQVVAVTQRALIGVSPADGAVLWEYGLTSQDIKAVTPVASGDRILFSGRNMGVTAIAPVRRDGKWSADVVWQTREVSMFMSNPVLTGDVLFGLSHTSSGQYFALNAENGKILWKGEPRAAANAAIVKSGKLLFLLEDDGELVVARASRTAFEPLRRYGVADSATWAQPAISGNRLFIKDVSSLALWAVD